MEVIRHVIVLCFVFYLTDATITWSKSYTLKAILTVPSANLKEPYQVWVEGDRLQSRVDFYGGLDKWYREWDKIRESYIYYKVQPETTKDYKTMEVCVITAKLHIYAQNTYLPDKNFKYIRNEVIEGTEVEKWQYSYTGNKGTFLVSHDVWVHWKNSDVTGKKVAVPIRYIYETKFGDSVYDYIRHDYYHFDDAKPAAEDVQVPSDLECLYSDSNKEFVPQGMIDPLSGYLEPEVEDLKTSESFERFKSEYNKIYKNEIDDFTRLNNFKNNLRFIDYINKKQKSFTVGINKFADLTEDEMQVFLGTKINADKYNRFNKTDNDIVNKKEGSKQRNIKSNYQNSNFDWRDYGAVTPIKDQTVLCGSCYAFASAATVESAGYIAGGCRDMVELSEQAIIDCTWRVGSGNSGCDGGDIDNSLEFAKQPGIAAKEEYGPYLAMEGKCHINDILRQLTKIQNFQHLNRKKQLIKDMLRKNGPLIAAVNTPRTFALYNGGIYDDVECLSNLKAAAHAVNVVGYGTTGDKQYWIVRNTFGAGWGEAGYMRLSTEGNICGLKNYVYTVTLEANERQNCQKL